MTVAFACAASKSSLTHQADVARYLSQLNTFWEGDLQKRNDEWKNISDSIGKLQEHIYLLAERTAMALRNPPERAPTSSDISSIAPSQSVSASGSGSQPISVNIEEDLGPDGNLSPDVAAAPSVHSVEAPADAAPESELAPRPPPGKLCPRALLVAAADCPRRQPLGEATYDERAGRWSSNANHSDQQRGGRASNASRSRYYRQDVGRPSTAGRPSCTMGSRSG